MKRIKNRAKRMTAAVILMLTEAIYTMPVYANGDTSKITGPINALATLMTSIIAAVGYIIIAKNIFEFAYAYQQQDSASTSTALKGIVSGILMAFVGTVIAIMGIK